MFYLGSILEVCEKENLSHCKWQIISLLLYVIIFGILFKIAHFSF